MSNVTFNPRHMISLGVAALCAISLAAQPVSAKGPFDKLEELVDKVNKKIDDTDRRARKSERTTRRTGSLLGRLGIGRNNDDTTVDRTARDAGNAVPPARADTSVGGSTEQPRRDLAGATGSAAFLSNLPVYPGARRVPTTDPRVPVVFFTPDSADEVIAFYSAAGEQHGFQALVTANPYPGVVLLNTREEGAVVATVPDGNGTRFFTGEGSSFGVE